MPRAHVLLALAVALVWGVNFVVIEVGLESFPPLLFVALRFSAIALPAVFFFKRPPVHWKWILLIGTFLSTGQFALLFVAMDVGMPAGLASLVLQLQVMFTIGLAVVTLGEKPTRAQAVGAAVALGGMGVIAAGRSGAVTLVALLLCVAAAGSWAVGNVCTRMAQAPDAKAMLVWSSLVPPVPLAALSLAFEDWGSASLDLGGLLALLYVVVLATAFGFGAWTWLLKQHTAANVVPFALAVPVAGMGSAWLALGERPNGPEAAGALVVLLGLGLIVLSYRAERRSPSLLGRLRLRWT
jgi:O-acetylserine/cysteine efflux transporter